MTAPLTDEAYEPIRRALFEATPGQGAAAAKQGIADAIAESPMEFIDWMIQAGVLVMPVTWIDGGRRVTYHHLHGAEIDAAAGVEVEPEVEAVFQEAWADIVAPGGVWNLAQTKRELHDYTVILRNVPQVYSHVTNGMIGKPNTLASEVISVHDESCSRFTRKATETIWGTLEKAANEGRNFMPEATDDQAAAIEKFAAALLDLLDG